MRERFHWGVRMFVLAATASTQAPAAILVPVTPVQGASLTTVFAINDSDVIAGSFIGSDGVEHCFFGTVDGNYTTFDAGTGGSEARGISNDGHIVGISNSQHGTTATQPVFERLPDGEVLNVSISGGQLFGLAQELNKKNKFAGYYWNTESSTIQGFLGKNGEWKSDVNISGAQFNGALGINDKNTIVGLYFLSALHGFVLSGETVTTVDYPSGKATATILNGINNNNKVAGQWIDTSGLEHSFLYDAAANTFTDIKVKGASVVRAWAINSAGAVAVSTDIGSYVWCKKAAQCPAGGSKSYGTARGTPR